MRKIIQSIIFSVILTSCNMGVLPIYFENRKLDMVPVEILEPASKTIPAHIQQLAIITPDSQDRNVLLHISIIDTTFNVYSENNEVLNIIHNTLTDNLLLSPRIVISNTDKITLPAEEITWERYDSICLQKGSDAVLTLDSYNAKYRYLTSDTYVLEYDSYFYKAYLEVTINSTWSIRDPYSRQRDVFNVNHSDYYEGGLSHYLTGAIETLPELREIVHYDASVLGEKCAEVISPHWITIERNIYASSHRDLRKAKRLILEENNWEGARSIWRSGADSKNRVLAKHSLFNLVVSEEVLGSIGDAIEKAKLYQLKFKDPHMDGYIEILHERLENKKLLDEQFHEANNTKSMLRAPRYSGFY